MATTGRSESRLFVRNSTGLVRSASAVDATIFNAVISAPVGSTLAWSIFFTLVAFPGADPVGVLVIAAIINIPVLIMFALLGLLMEWPGPLRAGHRNAIPPGKRARATLAGILTRTVP